MLTTQQIRNYQRQLVRASYSDEDEFNLFTQRNELIEKTFDGGLSAQEEKALRYINWQLDMIEDAQLGPHLDALEAEVAEREELAKEISEFAGLCQTISWTLNSSNAAPVTPST